MQAGLWLRLLAAAYPLASLCGPRDCPCSALYARPCLRRFHFLRRQVTYANEPGIDMGGLYREGLSMCVPPPLGWGGDGWVGGRAVAFAS